jgi:hypothetical protein
LLDRFEGDPAAADLGQDLVGGRGPDERSRITVARVQVALDLGDQVGYGMEYATSQCLVGELPEPTLDQLRLR